MNRHLLRIALLWAAMLACYTQGQPLPYWNNPAVYRLNTLRPHTNVIPDGDWRMSLDGVWQFRYFDSPAQAALFNLQQGPYPDSILVPGNIELQGFGVPVYVNMRNEFPSDPPWAPTDNNPVGIYSRSFTLPAHWQGRRTIVKVGAAGAGLYLYINGTEVGYNEDSKGPAEWDITRFLQPGSNQIVAKVVRWANGSYLECQDMWRMSGITRSVELYSVPATYIADYRVTADLDTADYRRGKLEVMVDLNREVDGGSVELVLQRPGYSVQQRRNLEAGDWFAVLQPDVGNVLPWSDTTPTLYTLTLRLFDRRGHLLETLTRHIGFRNISIREGQVLLNGSPMEIRGVNRHEHSATGGHFVSPDEMRADIRLMKQMGINAVRTSHYPNDELWYDLCDSAGLYLWDEANVESHAQGYGEHSLAKQEAWLNPILNRIQTMYLRDRNHPSVVAWSLGNECGNGYCMEEAYRFLKGKDDTRPVVYERAELDWNTDIVAIMYPSVDYLSAYAHNPANRRPYIIAEYCHAMGNSMGGLQDYWDTIDRYPMLQGGFIWDWIDQAFPLPDGSWAAGGDLGTLPGIKDDDAFCANGLLAADRTPHPHAAEVEAVYTRGRTNAVVPHPASPHPFHALEAGLGAPTPEPRRHTHNKQHIVLSGGGCRLLISLADGSLASFCHGGRELLATPLRCNLWRPPTENDLSDPNGARAWQGLDRLEATVTSVSVSDTEADLTLRLTSPDERHINVRQIVHLNPDGSVQLHYLVAPGGQFRTLPKVGIQLGIDTAFRTATFYGNIFETYPDRRAAQRISLWHKELAHLARRQYVVPQEQGNREAQWVHFAADTVGLAFLAPDSLHWLNFSVRRQDDTALTRARRWSGLPDADHYTVSIDHRQAGLGTATCGPATALRHTLSGDSSYSFRFLMVPTSGTPLIPPSRPDLPPHPALLRPLPADEPAPLPIAAIESSPQPSAPYAEGFPAGLADGQRAVPGDYSQGWVGYLGADTIRLDLHLPAPEFLSSITVGACHSPADWVVKPNDIQVQWSLDGRRWSPWQSLSPLNPPEHPEADSRRLRYRLALKRSPRIQHLRLRLVGRGALPIWHPYAGQPGWIMIDEIELHRR